MNKVITAKLWIMGSVLWVLPIISAIIFQSQNRNPWDGVFLILLPLVINLILIACALFPEWWFRKPEDYPLIQKVFVMLMIFMYYICIAVLLLLYSQGRLANLYDKMLGCGLGLFFIFLGNLMPKLRRNKIVGVRFPWTMTSDEVWRKVHYWAGIEAVIFGILAMVISFIFPIGKIKVMFAIIVVLLLWGVVSTIHSYIIAKKMEK